MFSKLGKKGNDVIEKEEMKDSHQAIHSETQFVQARLDRVQRAVPRAA